MAKVIETPETDGEDIFREPVHLVSGTWFKNNLSSAAALTWILAKVAFTECRQSGHLSRCNCDEGTWPQTMPAEIKLSSLDGFNAC